MSTGNHDNDTPVKGFTKETEQLLKPVKDTRPERLILPRSSVSSVTPPEAESADGSARSASLREKLQNMGRYEEEDPAAVFSDNVQDKYKTAVIPVADIPAAQGRQPAPASNAYSESEEAGMTRRFTSVGSDPSAEAPRGQERYAPAEEGLAHTFRAARITPENAGIPRSDRADTDDARVYRGRSERAAGAGQEGNGYSRSRMEDAEDARVYRGRSERAKTQPPYDRGSREEDASYDYEEGSHPIWPRMILVTLVLVVLAFSALCLIGKGEKKGSMLNDLYTRTKNTLLAPLGLADEEPLSSPAVPYASAQPVPPVMTPVPGANAALLYTDENSAIISVNTEDRSDELVAATPCELNVYVYATSEAEEIRLYFDNDTFAASRNECQNPDESQRLWKCVVPSFTQPYDGCLYAGYRAGAQWYRSPECVHITVSAAPPVTPVPAVKAESVSLLPGTVTPLETGRDISVRVVTSTDVRQVTLSDWEGTPLNMSDDKVIKQENGKLIWTCVIRFDEPYEGNIYVSCLNDRGEWEDTDTALLLSVTEPAADVIITPQSTQSAVRTPVPNRTAEPSATPFRVTPEPATPTPEPERITMPPTATPSPSPTPVPTAEPTPTPVPTPTPMPLLSVKRAEEADPVSIKLNEEVYRGSKRLTDYNREESLCAPDPDKYSFTNGGVFTFRGDNFRRNAAYGTAEITEGRMEILWSTPLGSLKTADSTVYGVGFGSQPAIIKWPGDVRAMMNLTQAKKDTQKLKEVIFAAQDGKVYFLDLNDGSATRSTINLGYPMKSSVSVDAYSLPILSFGQTVSKMPNGKTGKIGYYVYSLIDCSQLLFLNGRSANGQVQYNTNGAFTSSGLFLYDTAPKGGSYDEKLIVAGENGLIYTVDLNTFFDHIDTKTVKLDPEYVYQRSKAGDQKDNRTGIASAPAMYGRYLYTADAHGILRCVDTDTMTSVWALDCGDNISAAVALDWDSKGDLGLYTGNTSYVRLTKKQSVTLRRVDTLSGREVWSYEIACQKDSSAKTSGCAASPVIGQNSIDDLVIFTVNKTGNGKTSAVIALDKFTGRPVWQKELTTTAVSSPVAVYNKAGNAWIIQADESGVLHLLDGKTGSEISSLSLGGQITASPAVYGDILVIGTSDKKTPAMYGIQLK